jgi:hypothetical protein
MPSTLHQHGNYLYSRTDPLNQCDRSRPLVAFLEGRMSYFHDEGIVYIRAADYTVGKKIEAAWMVTEMNMMATAMSRRQYSRL